jgi:hypothetical protein
MLRSLARPDDIRGELPLCDPPSTIEHSIEISRAPREADMPVLDQEIAAYNRQKPELELHHKGKWALIHGDDLAGVFDSFENAATEAVERFGAGPFLVRQIGAPPLTLPASALYHFGHGKN